MKKLTDVLRLAIVTLAILTASAALTSACASWWSRTPEHVTDVAKVFNCVMEKRGAGITDPLAIAISCGLRNASEVIDLFKAADAHAAKVAKKPAGAASSPASASASVAPAVAPTPASSPVLGAPKASAK